MMLVKCLKFDFNPARRDGSIRERNEEGEGLLTAGVFLAQRPKDCF